MPGCENRYRDPTPKGVNGQDSTYPRSFDTCRGRVWKVLQNEADVRGCCRGRKHQANACRCQDQNSLHALKWNPWISIQTCWSPNVSNRQPVPMVERSGIPVSFLHATMQSKLVCLVCSQVEYKDRDVCAKNSIWTQPVNSLRKHSISWDSTLNTNSKALRTAEVPGMMKRLQCISFG